MGYVHGGVLMTFADYALCMEATGGYEEESCVTVSFNSEFVSSGIIVLSFSAVVKRMRKEALTHKV